MDRVFAALLEAAEEAAEGRGAQLTSPRVQQLRRHEQAKWGSGCHGGSLVARRRLTSGQTIGREHSPAHQQKIGLKIY